MPSTRRIKTLGFFLTVAVFTIFYLTNDSRRASSQDYYTSTVDALNAKDAAKADIARKFAESRHAAKQGAEPVAVKPVGEQGQAPTEIGVSDRGDESAGFKKVVAGRKAMKGGEKWDVASGKEAAMQVDKEGKLGEPETQEEHEMEMEMNAILKKGPIIIFSKSYCPFSAKAKRILLEKYTIVPAPYVVELDQHSLGSALQAALAKSTGRRTVPNVLINGKSIGGGDDVEALDVGGLLIDKVKSMAGKRIMEAKLAG